jgi:hypothetical protein
VTFVSNRSDQHREDFMARQAEPADTDDRFDHLMANVLMPLENIEFTIEQYLMENGARIDPETRFLLARVRDSVARAAVSTRRATLSGGRAQDQAGEDRALAYPAA